MGDDLLFIHLIIFRSIHGRPGEKILQDVARALAVDIRHCAGQLDVGALQHLLEAVELPGAFTDKALAVTDQLTQFPLLFIRDVTGLEQPMLEKVCYDNCCGIDVHKKLIVACFRKGNKQEIGYSIDNGKNKFNNLSLAQFHLWWCQMCLLKCYTKVVTGVANGI